MSVAALALGWQIECNLARLISPVQYEDGQYLEATSRRNERGPGDGTGRGCSRTDDRAHVPYIRRRRERSSSGGYLCRYVGRAGVRIPGIPCGSVIDFGCDTNEVFNNYWMLILIQSGFEIVTAPPSIVGGDLPADEFVLRLNVECFNRPCRG